MGDTDSDGWSGGREAAAASAPSAKLRARVAGLLTRIATERATPARLGLAVCVGMLVGTSPFFGFHFAICVVIATALGLNRVVTYLAANVSNPWLAPFIVFASVQTGHVLLTGQWLAMRPESFRQIDPWSFGRAWLLGGFVMGVALGVPSGLMTFILLRRYRQSHPMPSDPIGDRMEQVVDRYRPQGRRVHAYIAGKFRHDPVYRQIAGLTPLPAPIVDLGCGRGQTMLLLDALQDDVSGVGVDHDQSKIDKARRAAEGMPGIRFEREDIHTWPLPAAGSILMIDILHYNPPVEQDQLIRRAARSLLPGGRLIIRDIDTARGAAALVSMSQERAGRLLRLNKGKTLCFRPMAEIVAILQSEGLVMIHVPAPEGLSLGNVLIQARRADTAR